MAGVHGYTFRFLMRPQLKSHKTRKEKALQALKGKKTKQQLHSFQNQIQGRKKKG